MSQPQGTGERGKAPLFPLKHVLVYGWELSRARDLADVAERLRTARFYVVRPRQDVLVFTSLTRPGAVVMVMLEREPGRGDLVIVQGPEGPYGYEDIVRAVPVFARIAGIRLTGRWPSREG